MRERMKKKETPAVISFLKILAAMYLVSGLLLVVLAVLVNRMEQEELIANAGIIVIYAVSCILGGYFSGKVHRERKFMWGMLMGAVYFAILFGVSVALNMGASMDWVHLTTTMAICVGGGMAGGMIA